MTFRALLRTMDERQTSDLQLMAGLKPALRIQGEIVPMDDMERFTPASARELVYGILAGQQKSAFESDPATCNVLDFGCGMPGLGRFRFNVHRHRHHVRRDGASGVRGPCTRRAPRRR